MNPRPTDKELFWREERDSYQNSTFLALSHTWGDAKNQPVHMHIVQCVLRDNTAVWRVHSPNWAVYPTTAEPEGAIPWCARISTAHYCGTLEEAEAICQALENDLRELLGDGMPPAPAIEPETAPLVADPNGFAPTTRVLAHWSKGGGRLYFTRVWRKVDQPDFAQDREITDPDEERQCMRGYFRQLLIEESVTRLVTGGFGRIFLETPFASALMQCELEMISVSAMNVTVRRQGQPPEVIEISPPTTDEFMQVVALQMQARQEQLIKKVGNKTVRQLHGEIARAAIALGLDYTPPTEDQFADEGPGVLPVEIEDVHAGGGDITRMGHVPGARKPGGRR